jgi:hypothetical protein
MSKTPELDDKPQSSTSTIISTLGTDTTMERTSPGSQNTNDEDIEPIETRVEQNNTVLNENHLTDNEEDNNHLLPKNPGT